MADDDQLPPNDELEPDEPLEPSDPDNETPPDELDPAASDDENPDDQLPEGDAEPANRSARGVPDGRQRERRLSEQERFDRAVERAVERRLSQREQRPQTIDFEAQRRVRDDQRRRELDEARLNGPEAYADTVNRHMREDYQADQRSREIRDANERNLMRYDRLCDRNPIYESIRSDVEQEVRRLQGSGIPAPDYQIVADALLGRRYAERAVRQGNRQRRDAAATTARQTVRNPSNPAGHQPAQRRRGAQNFNEMSLEDMERVLGQIPVRGNSNT